MPDIFFITFLPFLVAFLVTTFLTPITLFLLKKYDIIDDPKRHKHPALLHTKPIPRGGGIPLFLGALLTSMIFIPFTNTMYAVFFAAFLALIIGVIDDKLNSQAKDVSPYLRFLINILTALIVVGGGVSMHAITNPFGGIINLEAFQFSLGVLPFTLVLSDILAVIWLIWIMNMINWSKGVDGQMPGIVAISAIVIGILSLRLIPEGSTAGAFTDAKLSFIIAGCALGFLVFNFYPAKIFPGYGATSLYLLLGVVSILSGAKLATAILVLGVPTVDALFTIVRRIANKRSPFLHDKKHLHHLLLQLGFTQRKVALFYWSLSAILGVIALSLESKSKVFALSMVIVVTCGTLFFLHAITRNAHEKTSP